MNRMRLQVPKNEARLLERIQSDLVAAITGRRRMPKQRLPKMGTIEFNRPSFLVRLLTLPIKAIILIGEITINIFKSPLLLILALKQSALKNLSVVQQGEPRFRREGVLSPVKRSESFSATFQRRSFGTFAAKSTRKKVPLFNWIPAIAGMTLGKRHRGRPRSTPFFSFYRRKVFKFLDQVYPKPFRMATILAVILTVVFGYSLVLVNLAHSLPSPDELTSSQEPLTSEFYDRNGKLLYRLYEGKNRQLVKLDELPQTLIQATIASEDKNFYNHPGVDLLGVARAIKEDLNAQNGDNLQGGSTITQQLIKNTLLTPEQTFKRKVKEALLAFWAERVFSKSEILQMYFNNVPYGGPAWGVKSAALTYFGKQPKDLNLAEAAYLAGLPAAPTKYSPYGSHPERGKQRQHEVLDRMVGSGFINQPQEDEALKQELAFKPPTIDIKAPHFVMYARQLLAQKYGEKAVSQGGLKVTTTLDLDIQEMAEQVVATNVDKLAKLNVSNGAAMVTDSKTGQILAMVGSKDYWDPDGGNFNAALALRSPGSSIKPVVYVTSFKQGFTPGTVLLDTPTSFPDGVNNYAPVNYDGKFHGAVSIRTALANSYNIPAVKTLATVGVPAVVETARDMGITTWTLPQSYGLSLTLGGAPTRLIDMMSVYGTFAAEGVRHEVTPILQVVDSQGIVLEDHHQDQGKGVLTPQVAYLISNILGDNKAREAAFGSHSLLEIKDHSVPVKTGTSDWKRDNLAFGYTPEYVVGAWVGNFDNSPMNPELTSGITGATPIWHDIMAALLEGKPDLAFKKPDGIVSDPATHDLAISGQTPKTVTALKRETKPDEKGEQKEVITYSDPFGIFTADQSATPKN